MLGLSLIAVRHYHNNNIYQLSSTIDENYHEKSDHRYFYAVDKPSLIQNKTYNVN